MPPSHLSDQKPHAPRRAQAAMAEHADIVEAIRRRDPDAADEAARRHVRAAQRERLKRLFPEADE